MFKQAVRAVAQGTPTSQTDLGPWAAMVETGLNGSVDTASETLASIPEALQNEPCVVGVLVRFAGQRIVIFVWVPAQTWAK